MQEDKQREIFRYQREESKQKIKEARFNAMTGHFKAKDEVLQIN